jgi:hypothetical protein
MRVNAVAVANNRVHAEAPAPGCQLRALVVAMPGTISHESPPSALRNDDAGSTPHNKSFLPPPGSSDQIFASARPSSLKRPVPIWFLRNSSHVRRAALSCRRTDCSSTRKAAACRACRSGWSRPERRDRTVRAAVARLRGICQNTPFLVPIIRRLGPPFSLQMPPAGW